MPTYKLNVNGTDHTVTVGAADMPLLWVLRDYLGLTGTKYGCGIEICAACSVLVNGQKEKSCVFDVSSAAGKRIVTIEGMAEDPEGKKVQAAWVAHQVPQCGFCQPGMIVATAGAIKAGHRGKEIIPELNHICVCGTYQRISDAVKDL